MSRYVNADYVKAVMLNDRLLQGNAEFTLYEQQVDIYVKALPSIDIVRCEECKYCVCGQCWKSDGLDKLDGNVADDDFCSRGEREGE